MMGTGSFRILLVKTKIGTVFFGFVWFSAVELPVPLSKRENNYVRLYVY